MVHQYVYSVYIIGWVMVWPISIILCIGWVMVRSISMYTLYWMGNGMVHQYVYSVYIIGWVMIWSISMYTLYISLDG